ncbi:YheC/YheD family protein [Bacillus sp. B-jedd]|uniref:YheC/YheD family protein n=1 Tax=Bacillus sp. B-jedd TaxID=1476857 RepID=UPI0005156D14|nr:YheC/YheD family protein [Bacillus sp. B-jedd]CEG26199.1 Endospore coat-associated protein yheD [Bacillus sp. B-jedd]
MRLLKFKEIVSLVPILKINRGMAKELGITNGMKVKLCYGMRETLVTANLGDAYKQETVSIDGETAEKLGIEMPAEYTCSLRRNGLLIGPVIGVLYGIRNSKGMVDKIKSFPERYLPYFKAVSETGGLLYFFSGDQVNYKDKKITGIVYDFPSDSWKVKDLPFPAVIFRRVKAPPELLSAMGTRFVNFPCMNKITFWHTFNSHPILGKHLPQTSRKIEKSELDAYLKKYGSVFLKQSGRSRGRGIFLITKQGSTYEVRVTYEERIYTYSEKEIAILLSKHQKNFMLQQAVAVKKVDGRPIAYRVNAVKNESGKWMIAAIHGLSGKREGITSHRATDDNVHNGEEMLKAQFHFSSAEARGKLKEMEALGLLLAKELNALCPRLIDLGIDMGIDENGDIYLFESNTLQDLHLPVLAGEIETYEKLVATIVKTLLAKAME